jgi:hypothetical protein
MVWCIGFAGKNSLFIFEVFLDNILLCFWLKVVIRPLILVNIKIESGDVPKTSRSLNACNISICLALLMLNYCFRGARCNSLSLFLSFFLLLRVITEKLGGPLCRLLHGLILL